MSYSKREFVLAAFDEIGIGSYQFDLSPEMLQVGLKRLDAMMASWNARGIRLGYPLASSPGSSDLDTATEVPDSANEAIYQNLAVRIASVFGKVVSPDTKQAAYYAYSAMISKAAEIPEMQFNQTVPAGQGNKFYRQYTYMLRAPEEKIDTEDSGYLDLNP